MSHEDLPRGSTQPVGRIVLFGASGDLTARLLMPAVAQLMQVGRLPADLQIVGSANTEWSDEQFREHIAEALRLHAAGVSEAARGAVVRRLSYRLSDVTDPADVRRVIGEGHDATLVYLALPSGLLEATLSALSGAGLGVDDGVAIEKPFGTDLDSARRLNKILRLRMPEPTVFRIDHFLTDELVRRILALRFLNRVFEPLLNSVHVERVDIHWLESLALEGRAGYYDRAGALKDMVQNHLMEALALVVMEEPARLDANSFRGNRVEALRAIPTPDAVWIRERTLRARYGAGRIEPRDVPAYVDEPGVDASRNTETFASVELEVRNRRWAGVPFTLRSGKALAEDAAEIAITFRPVPCLYDESLGDVQPNVLRIGLMQPYVRLGTTVNGTDYRPVHRELEMTAQEPERSAYANLLLEMLHRRAALFIRGDEAEEAWRIVDPIARAWQSGEVPLGTYAAGGPAPG